MCAAAFVGAIQQLQFGAESAVVDDPPESLLPLEQLSALLDHWLPTATGGLTTSPFSIRTPLNGYFPTRKIKKRQCDASKIKESYPVEIIHSLHSFPIFDIINHRELFAS